ncbi:hypothetical protein [Taklimakanibacter deserti]
MMTPEGSCAAEQEREPLYLHNKNGLDLVARPETLTLAPLPVRR